MNKSSPPTIRDIAEASGLSIGTVSQALNLKPGVRAETRDRVFEVARQLGYPVKSSQDIIPSKRLRTIGLLTKQDDDMLPAVNPFYSYVLMGTEQECQRHNIVFLFASLKVDSTNRVLKWPPMLFNSQVDALVVVGTFVGDEIIQLQRQTDSIVLVDAYAKTQDADSIVIDNLNGAYNAVSYLIESGHTHIGLVGSTADPYPSIKERRKGYTRALQDGGIDETYIEVSELSRDGGYEGTRRLLQRAPQVTAIFACNDEVAVGAMRAIKEMDLRIPEDISIMGFDDIDLATETDPPLTTVHVDKYQMGALAVRHLRDRAENPDRPNLITAVTTNLVIRDSVFVRKKKETPPT